MDKEMKPSERIQILVAEDDPNLGIILTEYLEAKGYDPQLARNGVEGWKLFANGSFDCCILDVMMCRSSFSRQNR